MEAGSAGRMTGQEIEDRINKAFWLPDGEPIITPEREAKGYMLIERNYNGEIRFAQLQLATVLNAMEQRGIIDSQHVHDAQTYEVWQTIFRSRLGYRNNPIYADDLARMRLMVSEDELDSDDFGKLIHALGANVCRAVEFAIYTPVTPHMIWLVSRSGSQYRTAFDRLSQVMERLRAEWRHRQDEKNHLRDV
jgi:hypothetical protein